MTVLTLAGKLIDWHNPPKPTDRVIWSERTTGGKQVTGSLRTIAHLDRLNNLSLKMFKSPVKVLQGPYNTTVKASAGTHDYDACLDVYIPGVAWLTQQTFFRANGAGAYWRRPPAFGNHIHYFTLPPREGENGHDGTPEIGLLTCVSGNRNTACDWWGRATRAPSPTGVGEGARGSRPP